MTVTAPADRPAHEVRAGSSRRGWLCAVLWLLAVATVQFFLGVKLVQFGQPLTLPAVLVAAAGLVLGLFGYLIVRTLGSRRGSTAPAAGVLRLFMAGTVVLTLTGLVWVLPGNEVVLLAGLGSYLVVVPLAWLLMKRSKTPVSARRLRWWVATGLVSLGAIVLVTTVPSALGVKFSRQKESRVAAALQRANSGYSIAQAPGSSAFPESCVVHLIGDWWEIGPGGGGAPCPDGFTYIPGG